MTWAEDVQLPPVGLWSTWLLMGGRGSGKTRAGAEWVRAMVEGGLARRIALVGPTIGDVREVMIEGQSGLRAIAPTIDRPRYEPSRRRLVWERFGAEGFVFSSEDPDSLRGPQFDAAWCDEIATWTHDISTWDTLRFGLRLGQRPRTVATTTPAPTRLVRRLLQMSETHPDLVIASRAPTAGNAHNLAPGFIEELQAAYGGTPLARQELEGELVDITKGALWTRAGIEAARVAAAREYVRIVVAIDPPAGIGRDACGIVAAGLTRDGKAHVLQDASVRGLSPLNWTSRTISVARQVGAGLIVAESNQGGELLRDMLVTAGANEIPAAVRLVHATQNKWMRAAPASNWFERGEAFLAGGFPDLEDEMIAFSGDGGGRSPDRLDAMVWAITELLRVAPPPQIHRL